MAFKMVVKESWAKESNWVLGTGIGKETILYQGLQKEHGPADNFILAQWDPCLISDFQNWKKINCVVLSQQICGWLLQSNR